MKHYAEWYSGDAWFRSPTFERLEDLQDYLHNVDVENAVFYCDF